LSQKLDQLLTRYMRTRTETVNETVKFGLETKLARERNTPASSTRMGESATELRAMI